MSDKLSHELAEAFLRWPLPESVCADLIATRQGGGRTGTNLLSYTEAKQMMEQVVLPRIAEQLERDNAALRAALEPFSKAADQIDGINKAFGTTDTPRQLIFVRLSDCRAARAALAGGGAK